MFPFKIHFNLSRSLIRHRRAYKMGLKLYQSGPVKKMGPSKAHQGPRQWPEKCRKKFHLN